MTRIFKIKGLPDDHPAQADINKWWKEQSPSYRSGAARPQAQKQDTSREQTGTPASGSQSQAKNCTNFCLICKIELQGIEHYEFTHHGMPIRICTMHFENGITERIQ